jgi:hypothetical protein
MSVTIYKDFGTGGAGLNPAPGSATSNGSKRHPPLAEALRSIVDDLVAAKAEVGVSRGNALLVDVTDLRTKFIAALTALDGDSGVTDTNYAATQSPAALTATAILSPSQLLAQLNALRVDLIAIRASLITAYAKLDADAGVTDTNYGTVAAPAALTAVTITDLSAAATLINQLVVDRAALRTSLGLALAKLDADATVNLTTYAATHAAAAPTAGSLTALSTLKG